MALDVSSCNVLSLCSQLFCWHHQIVTFLRFFSARAEGLGWFFYESIIAKAAKDKPSVSVDIGLLIAPLRFAEFGSVLYAGLIAQNLGYAPVFASSGIFFLIFSLLALYLLRK